MEKKERRRVLIHRQKSYLTAGVVTLVAVVAMMGAYQYEKRAEKQEQQEQVTLAEQTDTAETQNTTNADDTQETMVTQKPDQQTENTVSNQADSSALAQTDTVQGSTDTTAVYQQVQTGAALCGDRYHWLAVGGRCNPELQHGSFGIFCHIGSV